MAFKVYTGSNQTIGGIKTFSSYIAADGGIVLGGSIVCSANTITECGGIDMDDNNIIDIGTLSGDQGYVKLDNSTYGVWIQSDGTATNEYIVLSADDGIWFNSAMASGINMAENTISNVKLLDGDYGQLDLDYNSGGIGALLVAATSGYLYLDGPSGCYFPRAFAINSASRIPNLNADMVDSLHLLGGESTSFTLNDNSAVDLTVTHNLGTTNYVISCALYSPDLDSVSGGGVSESWSIGIDQKNSNNTHIIMVNESGTNFSPCYLHYMLFRS